MPLVLSMPFQSPLLGWCICPQVLWVLVTCPQNRPIHCWPVLSGASDWEAGSTTLTTWGFSSGAHISGKVAPCLIHWFSLSTQLSPENFPFTYHGPKVPTLALFLRQEGRALLPPSGRKLFNHIFILILVLVPLDSFMIMRRREVSMDGLWVRISLACFQFIPLTYTNTCVELIS